MVCAKNLPSSGFFTIFISVIEKVTSGGPRCAACKRRLAKAKDYLASKALQSARAGML